MEVVIERVQLIFDLSNIVDVAVANNQLYIAIGASTVIQIDLDNPATIVDLQLPRKADKPQKKGGAGGETQSIRAIFVDPTGTHLVVATHALDYFYARRGTNKLRPVTKLRGVPVSAIGWNPAQPLQAPGIVLLGTRQGTILETELDPAAGETYFKRDSRPLKQLWAATATGGVGAAPPIRGLSIRGDKTGRARGALVLAGNELSTLVAPDDTGRDPSQPFSKLFVASPQVYEIGAHASESSNTAAASDSPLLVSPTGSHFAAHARGTLVVGAVGSDPSTWRTHEVGVGAFFLISRYHLLIVDPEAGLLKAYNLVSNEQVGKVLKIPLESGEKVAGAAVDPQFETFWIWTARGLLEVKLEHESQGMWSIYLRQGAFEAALRIADTDSERRLIYAAWGESELTAGRPAAGARYYGKSSADLEGVALRLLETGERAALAELFAARLEHTHNEGQQIILSAWIVELYLQLDDFDALHEFFDKTRARLDTSTLFQLLAARGNDIELVAFAERVGDWKFVLGQKIAAREWDAALRVLREHEDPEATYEHAILLLTESPRATVDSWLRLTALDPVRLLPALIAYATAFRGASADNQAVRYLRHQLSTTKGSDLDPALTNALVTIYAMSGGRTEGTEKEQPGDDADEEELLGFLRSYAHTHLQHDYDFALRMCLNHGRFRSAIYLYSLMRLPEEAVDLALQNGYVDRAVELVDKEVDSDQLREVLWRKVARHLIARRGADEALALLGRVKVENLLELFPDFETLDRLAPEIVKALEASNNKLQTVNQEIEETLRASRGMQDEISGGLRKRYVLVEAGEPCLACMLPLAVRKFFVFPCQHGMHMDCLVGAIESGPDGPRRHRLVAARSASDASGAVDAVVAEKCVLCSEARIELVDKPLVGEW